jgi:hypothetical protein
MPYALFCNEAQLSKAYPTEADVWKLAQQSGLVVDATSDEEKPNPRPVLDNDYEIRPCATDPHEDPVRNKEEAERDRQLDLQLHDGGVYATYALGPVDSKDSLLSANQIQGFFWGGNLGCDGSFGFERRGLGADGAPDYRSA